MSSTTWKKKQPIQELPPIDSTHTSTLRYDQSTGSVLSPSELHLSSLQNDILVSIHPLMKPRLYWDLFLSILLFFNGIIIPLHISYGIIESSYDPIFWINRFIDMIFLLDIICNSIHWSCFQLVGCF